MIPIANLAQITGIVTIFLFACLSLNIAIVYKTYERAGRIALLWISIYILFLFLLRLFSLIGIGTVEQLRIVSGFSSLISLVALLIHLFMVRKIEEKVIEEVEHELHV